MFEQLRADFQRHGGTLRSPGFWLIAAYRFGRWAQDLPGPARKFGSAAYALMLTASERVPGSPLHRETQIVEDFRLVHRVGLRLLPVVLSWLLSLALRASM